MPRKPKKPCSYPNCPKLTYGRYCEEHQRLENKRYEKYGRQYAIHQRYGRAWQKIRENYVKTHPYCELCFQDGIMKLVEEVHHKMEHMIRKILFLFVKAAIRKFMQKMEVDGIKEKGRGMKISENCLKA